MLRYYRVAFLVLLSIASTALIVYISAVGPLKYYELKNQRLAKLAVIKPVKVFQIGFSKCGTTTLAKFFNMNGVSAVHQDYGNLPKSIYDNYRKGLSLISPRYDKYHVYTDMEVMGEVPQLNIGMMLFKELDKQYPGSKFILNTRNKMAWLKSKSLHRTGSNKSSLLELTAQLLNISQAEVLAKWSAEWDAHHIAVIEYFKNRPNDLLVFDIEQDNPKKLTEFLKDNFLLDVKFYGHENKTVIESGKYHVSVNH